MNKKQRLELAKWAISYAKKVGADDLSVDISKQRTIEIEFRNNKLDKVKESTQNSLYIAVYKDYKFSGHSTNNLDKTALKKFISEAVAMTKYLSVDKYRSLPDPELYLRQKQYDLKIKDPGYINMSSKRRVQIAKEIEQAALAQSKKIISVTSSYSDYAYEAVKVHSNGFTGDRESTSFSAGAEATVRDKDKGRPEDWYYVSVRNFKDMPEPATLGIKAVNRALRKIGQTKIESGTYDMLIENRSGSRLLYSMYYPLTGRAIQQKRSFLEGRLGQKIASAKLTLTDDPFIPGGMGSRHYDSDGISANKRIIIDKGILKSYYIDNYYGKKLALEPTSGSPSNLIFEYGKKSLEQMIKEIKKGILVTGFIGGNSNSTTGDFSFGIVGQLIENGKIIKPINEMNITGNLETVWGKLSQVGNDPYIFSSLRIPSLYFKDIQFSGI